ncbi:unnamed protein product [Meganyctiphanes norvegica]|uniref:Uncharacterized protein n=1 Tax=Meganyctiphanes norvegica TaxID=48144 RepID=A0AAV2SH01_MEGNR
MVHRITLLLILYVCGDGDALTTTTCYECSTDPESAGSTYDEDCGDPSYDGNYYVSTSQPGCATFILDNGYMWRGFATQSDIEGEVCQHGYFASSGLQCWCIGYKCNSHLCEECIDATTTTTTATTTTTTTTIAATIPTTTEHQPSKGLSCYSCVGCPTVDETTPVVFDEDFLTCVIIETSPEHVVRSGGLYAYPDGECYVSDHNVLFCHCTTSLCNGSL